VRQAPQGHCPADLHSALVDLISGLLPVGAQVVLLGDGACNGPRLQQTLQQAGWSYACRTATSTVATGAGEPCRLDALGSCLKPGRLIELREPDGVIAVDPSSFPKRGTHSVGVKCQWCSHRGKVDNYQVGVFMGYVSRHDHALLDFRLSLPEEWARGEHRRQACHVPEAVAYHTRHEQCLEMLDLWRKQVPHGRVTGDDALGCHSRFRQVLQERGECYVLGVPCTTIIRDLEAPLPCTDAGVLY
jgi:hypothetical protein